ncbi:MAG TPA: intradiol ring-cleavage dioxygenase [Vicinamibacterales bacterium]|jgi:protocatechuate 3,4-dioxygenase beta subunit|nr:intradiol ring-cleavage dioxygenase [Vicinamibacterales bacterium]
MSAEPIHKDITRRQALGLLGAAAGAGVLSGACSSDSPTSPSATTSTTTTNAACAVTPTETIGPYPSLTDLFRSDIREGRSGLPVNLTITVVNSGNACAPVPTANVEIWQCDAEGHYSQYSQQGYDGRAQTFLRGIQTTDSNGRVTFTTVYPGWYQGRATHIHVEVTINGASVKATQIAFPDNTNAAVYATGVYASRGNNPTSNARDNIFADSLSSEMATVVGDTTNGYTATFTVAIAV